MQENQQTNTEKSTDKKGEWLNNKKSCKDNVNTVKVLTEVYNNALMAKETTEAVLKKTTNMELADILRSHVNKYDDFARSAQILANTYNCILNDENKGGRAMSKMSLNMKLMGDDSVGNIAKLIILGTTNGVIELGTLIRHTPDISEKTEKLVKDLLCYEESRIEEMKYYL